MSDLKQNPEMEHQALELLGLLRRLASLRGELSELVEAPLDSELTSLQAAKWLQCGVNTLNDLAKHNKIPATPIGNQWRFHPRTIIEESLRRFHKKNGLQ